MAPKGPYKLVTVNSAPDRAFRLVGRVVEDVKDQYTILHTGNAESPETARIHFEIEMPNIVFTSSMWTKEESSKVIAVAKDVNPEVKTLALPHGLLMEKGADAVVEYIKQQLPKLLGC